MIGDILCSCYSPSVLRNLYDDKIVSYCLFRSFDDFKKSIILRFITNGGVLKEKDLREELKQSAFATLRNSLQNFEQLCIMDYSKQSFHYTINDKFVNSLERSIIGIEEMKGQPRLRNTKFEETNKQFELLRLLYESNDILNYCGLTRMDYSKRNGQLTKKNFEYIKASTADKICILIKGYLKYKPKIGIIKGILNLSLMNQDSYDQITISNEQIIHQLQSIKLLQTDIINDQKIFFISDYLHHFAFLPDRTKFNHALQCKVIIQANFKIYIELKNPSKLHYKVLKSILSQLIYIEYQEYNFQQLIVGQITRSKMNDIFSKQITTIEFFDFFRQYMDNKSLSTEKDLGKWNKIKFLGLEGPNEQQCIPNNVKQELRLWETLYKSNSVTEVNDLYCSDSN